MGTHIKAIEQTPTLDDLAARLLTAKNRAEAARLEVERIEDELASILGHEEQPHRFESDDFTTLTSSNVVRTVDDLGVMHVAPDLGEELVSVLFPLRHRLDLGAYFELRETDPDKFAIASRAVTIQNRRPTIAVARREV